MQKYHDIATKAIAESKQKIEGLEVDSRKSIYETVALVVLVSIALLYNVVNWNLVLVVFNGLLLITLIGAEHTTQRSYKVLHEVCILQIKYFEEILICFEGDQKIPEPDSSETKEHKH